VFYETLKIPYETLIDQNNMLVDKAIELVYFIHKRGLRSLNLPHKMIV